jgi:hypothetical protein
VAFDLHYRGRIGLEPIPIGFESLAGVGAEIITVEIEVDLLERARRRSCR